MLDDALQRVGEKILGFCLMSIKCIDTYLLVASILETIYLSYLVSLIFPRFHRHPEKSIHAALANS